MRALYADIHKECVLAMEPGRAQITNSKACVTGLCCNRDFLWSLCEGIPAFLHFVLSTNKQIEVAIFTNIPRITVPGEFVGRETP